MAAAEQQEKNKITENISRNWLHIRSRLYVFLVFFLLLALVICAYFFNLIFINIYSGEKGVYWKRFGGGTQMDYIYNEGLHVIPPWNKMYIYDTRVQHKPFSFEALSKDGLRIGFEVSVRYYPVRQFLPILHKTVGPAYAEKIVLPEVQANVRKVVANYLPEEIYTSEGYLLQIIMQGALGALAERHINLDDLLIRRMILPQAIVDAIERKLSQEQYVQEYEYRLQTELKEAKRKAIEAEGIKRFQDIVKSSGFFDKYLQYKGIDATVSLAKSSNSKVVVIGGGGEGNLPLIMNMDSSTVPSQPENDDNSRESNPHPPASSTDKNSIKPNITESEISFLSRLKTYLGSEEDHRSPRQQKSTEE